MIAGFLFHEVFKTAWEQSQLLKNALMLHVSPDFPRIFNPSQKKIPCFMRMIL